MSAPITLKCPNCAAPLRSEDWNFGAGIIKCGHCGVLSTVPGSAAGQSSTPGFQPRAEIPLPPSLTFDQTPLGVELRRRWFSAIVFFLIPFCIVWDSFIIFWYSMAFGDHHSPWIMKVFPLAHVAVGVGLTYFTLATLFNSTSIATINGRLRVAHGPVPWMGNVELDGSEISQLFCKELVRNNKNGRSYYYEVWAVLRDSITKKVVGAGLTMEQALFIEQKLEGSLGIKDHPVPGEVKR
jgi:hypothetical protein